MWWNHSFSVLLCFFSSFGKLVLRNILTIRSGPGLNCGNCSCKSQTLFEKTLYFHLNSTTVHFQCKNLHLKTRITCMLPPLTFASCLCSVLQVEVEVPQGQPSPHDALRVWWLHRWMWRDAQRGARPQIPSRSGRGWWGRKRRGPSSTSSKALKTETTKVLKFKPSTSLSSCPLLDPAATTSTGWRQC